MSLVVQQLITASPGVGFSYLVQDVINRVSQDTRFQLSASANPDQNILIDYTNRVHQELLRWSRWEFLQSPTFTFTTVVGETDYYVGVDVLPSGTVDTGLHIPDMHYIKRGTVYDHTNFRPLYPTEEPPLAQVFQNNGTARFYRQDGASLDTISIYPPPGGAYTISFRYFIQPVVLTGVNDPIQVPDKYLDVLIAGINEKAFVFLKKQEEATYWANIYQQGKTSMIKDRNLHPRGTEFISVDPITQGNYWWNSTGLFTESGTTSGVSTIISGGGSVLTAYTLQGAINGVNTSFNLSATPPATSTVLVFRNGVLQNNPADYSINSGNIIFTSAPQTGDILAAYF